MFRIRYPIMKKFIFSICLGLLLLVVLELGLRAVYFVKDRTGAQERHDNRIGMNVGTSRQRAVLYGDEPMDRIPPGGYWDEFKASNRSDYHPYYIWRRKPFAGEFINVGPDGIRATQNPDHPAGAEVKSVWCFGGSTTWGTGARDRYTVPAILSRLLNAGGEHYDVVNCGESGYVMLQEVTYLMTRLARGERPDLVVFYDGLNDFYISEPGSVAEKTLARRFRTREREGAATAGVLWREGWSSLAQSLV